MLDVNDFLHVFYFFLAEDGIRDLTVTGVRRVLFRSTSAWRSKNSVSYSLTTGSPVRAKLFQCMRRRLSPARYSRRLRNSSESPMEEASACPPRSEERRVGKRGERGVRRNRT